MDIDHVHFYVEDAQRSRDWFVQTMGFAAAASYCLDQTQTEVVRSGPVHLVLSSPQAGQGAVATYLQQHPAGVVDLALQVRDLPSQLERAIAAGARLLHPLQTQLQPQGQLVWCQIQGWGNLQHTLIQRSGQTRLLPWAPAPDLPVRPGKPTLPQAPVEPTPLSLTGLDHAVLNVPAGELQPAVAWYQQVLGFELDRRFTIQTPRSGLHSAVLVHPQGTAQLPINEPASASSQIQEFLDQNRGPGIQHLALHSRQILSAIADLRRRGLAFLEIPPSYYPRLRQHCPDWATSIPWTAIEQQQVLVDWQPTQPQAFLLQTFTQPIFAEPTFFFELIQRHGGAKGFGEGNFFSPV